MLSIDIFSEAILFQLKMIDVILTDHRGHFDGKQTA